MKKHLVIIGKVQGVGFRYWMKNLAINNNINGWVKNKMSGDVEALIVGNILLFFKKKMSKYK